MAEAKDSRGDEGKAGEGKASETPTVDVTRIDITPVTAALTDPIELEVEYDVDGLLCEASWEIKFMVDSAHKRHVIVLGSTDVESTISGPASFYFSVPHVDVSDITPGTLTNCGLLTASLQASGQGVLDVNMVVVVTKEAGGLMARTIYSPLED